MEKTFFTEYKKKIDDILMNDFVSFWEEKSVDPEYGGYLCGFDREGNLFYEDKSVWQQGRSLWMFSKLYNDFGQKKLWLDAAKSGYDFINNHCFAENGHMYFRVTRKGEPLVERRYYFSEAFAVMGYAGYYKATKDESVKKRAVDLYNLMLKYYKTPGYFPPKINPETRRNRGHSIVMIMMNVSQQMREIDDNPVYDEIISECIKTITEVFIKEDKKVLLETVGANGEFLDTPEGRFINPGHSMETAWFMMKEAIHRKDNALMEKSIKVTEWSLERGFDEEMGGIFYFVDLYNKPVLSLEWDMKLFWVHCEAMVALTYSYLYTKDDKYMRLFAKIFDYVCKHFADPGYPEWYGHLHRDGTPISQIKGSDWKGPFHNVRAFMVLSQLFEKIENGEEFDL